VEFFFDEMADPSILLVPLPRGLRGFPRVFFSRAHDRAGFVQLADRIGFCCVPETEERWSLTVQFWISSSRRNLSKSKRWS